MKRRILLVDDELAILLTLRAILEMNGFEVDTAASTKEAERKMNDGVFEMVISDMRMESETAGYEVIRKARQQPYDPATAILTAYPSLGNEWQIEGAHSLLVKPVNTDELLRQLESLLITHQDHKAGVEPYTPKVRKVVHPNHSTSHHSAAAKEAL
jgi:DNA-binding response OmpR family regulator